MIVGLLLMGDLATARDDDSFSADDARNFTRQIFQADFSTIEVSGNNITFYGPDGELQCRSEYRFAGKMNGPGFDEGKGPNGINLSLYPTMYVQNISTSSPLRSPIPKA
jgi:hypothetical protein